MLERPSAESGSFLGAPVETDVRQVRSPFAIVGSPHGSPYDMRGVASDAANAPAAVRGRSRRFARLIGNYDFDLEDDLFADPDFPITDCGDVPADPRDLRAHLATTTASVAGVIRAGAVPIVLGGDDSVVIPTLAAFERSGPLHIVHIDAHLDFRDEVAGVRDGYSSPMRRATEMPWVQGITHVGLRGVGSSRRLDVEEARAAGHVLVTADAVRTHAIGWLLDQLPRGARFFVSMDIDGLDPSIAPGTSAPLPGGLLFGGVAALYRGLSERGRVVGAISVEYFPSLDRNWMTADVIIRLLVNLIGTAHRTTPGRTA